MKTYKTWEVIKMLEENPKLEFETELKICKCKVLNENGNIVFRNVAKDDYILDYYGCRLNNFKIEWTLVQKPVTWEEVLKSDKNVRVEHELIRSMSYNHYFRLDTLMQDLSTDYGEKDLRKILSEAKFYLEEE